MGQKPKRPAKVKVASKTAPQSDTFYASLATMAEKLRHEIIALVDDERLPYLHRRAVGSEVVFGVWPDPRENAGFGFHLIKGRGHLAALLGEPLDELTTTAIPCVGLEQAMAAEQLWGERDPNQHSQSISTDVKGKDQAKKGRSPKSRSNGSKKASSMRH
jgi:hypothetical protein